MLVDFGILEYIEENLGQITKAFRQGTPKYMSPDMFLLKRGLTGLIDLYFNDLYGL